MSYFGNDPMFTLMVIVGVMVFIGFTTMMYVMFRMSRSLRRIDENTKSINSGSLGVSINNVDTDKQLAVRASFGGEDTASYSAVNFSCPERSTAPPGDTLGSPEHMS